MPDLLAVLSIGSDVDYDDAIEEELKKHLAEAMSLEDGTFDASHVTLQTNVCHSVHDSRTMPGHGSRISGPCDIVTRILYPHIADHRNSSRKRLDNRRRTNAVAIALKMVFERGRELRIAVCIDAYDDAHMVVL